MSKSLSFRILGGFCSVLTACAVGFSVGSANSAHIDRPVQADSLPSSSVLALLPDGEEKRRFILDCTGCHQLEPQRAFVGGAARSATDWSTIIHRMNGMAGATTGFPVISAYRDAESTALWLSQYLRNASELRPISATGVVKARAVVREYLVSHAGDLPHDIAIDSTGKVLITGMFSHRMMVLDTASGQVSQVDIPVPNANPRAVEVDKAGRWWVVLGGPRRVARYSPNATGEKWAMFDAGMYAHSVALAPDGNAWVNGHFTKNPEIIARVDTTKGTVENVALPKHPAMSDIAGGPIPYEVRVAPNGVVWMSELQGNRLIGYNPATRTSDVIDMPETYSGPRRFDIDRQGILWVPAYSANTLVRIDPAATGARRVQQFPLPLRDAVPYVARVDERRNVIWIGTSANSVVFRFDRRTSRFNTYDLPSRGAMVRHMVVDPRSGDLWLAYGASPGIASRVARLRPAE
jgi:streptogramin lyase